MYGPTAATRDGPVCCPAWPSEGCCSVKESKKEQRNGRRAEVYLDKVSDEITKKKDRVWHKEVN